MNSIQDPSKKTSINSLLNPEASSTAFSNQIPNLAASNQLQPHGQHLDVYNAPFVTGSSFNLRAADWSVSDDAGKRKSENSMRHYHHNIGSSDAYSEHATPRMARARDHSNGYGVDGHVWQQQQDVPYGAAGVAPMYSDERTGLSAANSA